MPTTSLYIPLTKFSINEKDGFKVLYDSLVQSGPAFKLIVHESPAWSEIKDAIENPEQIVILDAKKADYYKQASKDFFAPFTEAYQTYKNENGTTGWTANLVMDMRCALSYILIANDYKARIFDKDVLDYDNPLESMIKNNLPDECINRVRIVDNLLKGYTQMNVPTVYMNRDKAEIENLKKVLLHTDMQTLSTLNYKYGEILVNKQVLMRNITEFIKDALKTDGLLNLLGGLGALGLSVWGGLDATQTGLVELLVEAGATKLTKINFKEYVPPIEDSRLFSLGTATESGVATFSAERFNYEYSFYIERQRS